MPLLKICNSCFHFFLFRISMYIIGIRQYFYTHNIIIKMETDHNKLVQQIEKRMAGASMLKSEEQKKQQLFEYGKHQSQFPFQQNNQIKQQLKMKVLISSQQAEKALKDIYNFYLNSYSQPHHHFNTFDQVNQKKLTFQPYILFMKNFKLLKTIFHVQKLKILFKKYSNFGQHLTYQNFIFLINELSHEPEAKMFFNIDELNSKPQIDIETIQQIEQQQMYGYLGLDETQKYKKNFKQVFRPFLCKEDVDTKQIKYTYRKFSQPQLLKKSLPSKARTQQKQLYIIKENTQKNNVVTTSKINKTNKINEESDQNPFGQVKSIVVSWQSLRAKSLANLHKKSQDIIKKKYVKDEQDDDEYLREYDGKQKKQKRKLEMKIQQIAAQQELKNKQFLAKLEQKTAHKSLLLSKKYQ